MQIHLDNSRIVLQRMDEVLQCLEQASSEHGRSQLQEANHLNRITINAQLYQMAIKNVSIEQQAAIVARFFGELDEVLLELQNCVCQLSEGAEDAQKLRFYSIFLIAVTRHMVACDRQESATN